MVCRTAYHLVTESINEKSSDKEILDAIAGASYRLSESGYSDKIIIAEAGGSIFSMLGKGGMKTVKETVILWVLNYLGLKGPLANYLKSSLADLGFRDLMKLMNPNTACDVIIEAALDGLADYLAERGGEALGIEGHFGNLISTSIADAFSDQAFIQKLEDKLTGTLCDKIEQTFRKASGGLMGLLRGKGKGSDVDTELAFS